jgi:hypothetical protein
MTGKSDFAAEEWELIARGPATAGLIAVTAQRGGTFRETLALTRAYGDARRAHGQSELLDEIVSAKPQLDRTRYDSPEDLREHGLQHLRDAVSLLGQKATSEELESYKRFVLDLAERVASAHREDGDDAVSPSERAALDQIAEALGTSSA